jgi:hypothetical protein
LTSNQIVLKVVDALEQLGIPYMLVGSYSSNAFGHPRSTQDADFVVELGNRPATTLFERLAPDLQFDPQMKLETVTMTGRYVGRHADSGFKVELFELSSDEHDRERFRRRRQQPFLGSRAFLPLPEDVVVQKLRWFERSRRAKDLDDVKNVLAVQAGKLDLDYIRRWCDQHGTRTLFEQLLQESLRFLPEKP